MAYGCHFYLSIHRTLDYERLRSPHRSARLRHGVTGSAATKVKRQRFDTAPRQSNKNTLKRHSANLGKTAEFLIGRRALLRNSH